jgi:hypothetical protein
MKETLVAGWIFAICAANAQIGAGTIIVFELTQDKFVIAADSRGGF